MPQNLSSNKSINLGEFLDSVNPRNWEECLAYGCNGAKVKGYPTCGQPHCVNFCPDADCRDPNEGGGMRDRSQHVMCRRCWEWFRNLQGRNAYWVYLLTNGYIGMTSNLSNRDKRHNKGYGSSIIWNSPKLSDGIDAFACEWALKTILARALGEEKGRSPKSRYQGIFKDVTGFPADLAYFEKQHKLFS